MNSITLDIPQDLETELKATATQIGLSLSEYILNLISKKTAVKNTQLESTQWPQNFFEKTAGCLADDPIERAPQGDYEIREILK
jgi:hypothetical protein